MENTARRTIKGPVVPLKRLVGCPADWLPKVLAEQESADTSMRYDGHHAGR